MTWHHPFAAVKRPAGLLGLEVPEGQLDPSLGHAVAAEDGHFAGVVVGIAEILQEDEGDKEVLHQVPGRLGRLAAIERRLFGDALAPAADSVFIDPDEAEGPVVGPAEARFKKVHVRELEKIDLDPLDGHGRSSSSGPA